MFQWAAVRRVAALVGQQLGPGAQPEPLGRALVLSLRVPVACGKVREQGWVRVEDQGGHGHGGGWRTQHFSPIFFARNLCQRRGVTTSDRYCVRACVVRACVCERLTWMIRRSSPHRLAGSIRGQGFFQKRLSQE